MTGTNNKIENLEFKLESDGWEQITITDAQYKDFLSYINFDGIECPFSELFGISEAKNEKSKRDFNVKQHTYDFFCGETRVNPDKLFEVVKKNNAEYLSEGVSSSFNDKLSDSQLKKCCDVVADTVNWGIDNIQEFDYDRIGCILGNLKIVERNSFNYGTFNEKNNVLSLTPSMINGKEVDGVDMYELTISHETMHLMQCYCPDVFAGENDSFIGVSYTFDNLSINPLRNRWLFEASAELNATLKKGIEPTTYKYMIENLETISLATVLNDNIKARQLEKISFTNNVKMLYDQLEFKDIDKSIAFLYAIELLREHPEEFKLAYEQKNSAIDGDYQEFLKITYYPYFVEVTSKLFYKNLADKLVGNSISINDVFYLISLYEMDLINMIPLDNKTVREKYPVIYEDYLSLQNEFFAVLQKNSDIDLKSKFLEYSANYEDDGIYINANLDWLDNDKISYIKDRNEALYKQNFKNICSIENQQ